MVKVEINGKTVELTLERLCALACQFEASDLHIKDGAPPTLRIDGALKPMSMRPLSGDEIHELVASAMNERQAAQYERLGSIDLAYGLPSGDRFRVNVFRQRGRTSVAARRVVRVIPTFEELHLPAEVLQGLCRRHQGLVIVGGQSGTGKSTTIAACLDYINHHRACHIVTVEDPIEYLHEDDKALISQREVGTDVDSMDGALTYLMREDPDVVLIGEMRDRDTFEAALRAAETGHLVFATLHTLNPASAIGRILDLYPDELQGAVRHNLAFNLAGIVCQMLVPSALEGTKRVPAFEILIVNSTARHLIRDGEDEKLEAVVAGRADGMIDFTSSFAELASKGWIAHQTAYDFAPNTDAVRMALKGIAVKQGIIR